MLETDSAFDEQNLGFSGFLKFLQSVPEIVKLYQVGQVWHARTKEPDIVQIKVNQGLTGSSLKSSQPTLDLYKRLLRKSSWRTCEPSFLCEALRQLKEKFPEGFTRSQEFEFLVEAFGHDRTRGELRSVIYLLYKAGYVQQDTKQNDEVILTVALLDTENRIAEKVDLILVNRLAYLCQANNVPLSSNIVASLLHNSYGDRLKDIIAQANSAVNITGED
jgi:hypothetical protein